MRLTVSALLACLALGIFFTMFSSVARSSQCASVPDSCDTKGGGWAQSEFPHAVVGGCDYVEGIFEGVSGQLLYLLSIPDLTPACNVHDRCYYSNASESAETCNRRFFEAMTEICEAKFSSVDLLSVVRFRACITWVAEIAETVHSVAERLENLPRARESQRDYMKFIGETCALKTWDPYPCEIPAPSECKISNGKRCCRNKCVPSCTKGESKWDWPCSE